MTHYQLQGANPTAIITKNRSELKVYEKNSIYLNDGDTFEVRLFNPLNERIAAEIIFNGIQRSSSKIILRPGEDVTIERFLDDNKKMKFDTYQIDGDNKNAVKAIEKNGLIEIKFYKEQQNYNFYNTGIITTNNPTLTTNLPYCGDFNTTTSTYTSNVNETFNTTSNGTMRGFGFAGSNSRVKKSLSKSLETGRVEKGEESKQVFESTTFTSQTFPFCTIAYELKPNSVKPQTINEIRQYCNQCSYRIRKNSYRFCPKCGSKLE